MWDEGKRELEVKKECMECFFKKKCALGCFCKCVGVCSHEGCVCVCVLYKN